MDNKESQIEIPEQPIVAKTEEENQEKDEYVKCGWCTVLEIKQEVATVTTDEAARHATLVKRTTAREPELSPKKKVQDDDYPKLRPKDKQCDEENNLFQNHIMKRETKRIKNEAKKREQTGTNIPSKSSMKRKILDMKSLI